MTGIPASRQLPLALGHLPEYGRDSFLIGQSNRAALSLVETWPNWPAPVVVLSGPAGSGKTHLAHIWAARVGAGWLTAADLRSGSPVPLPSGGGLVVEDVDGHDPPVQALFHLINSAKESGASLLLTSRVPAAGWRVALPDLRSRLRMAAPATLHEPDDDLLRQVVVKLFADRQLTVDKPVLDYLVLRMERSLSAAAALVEALDREALAAGQRITRPMAGRILAGAGGAAGEFADRQ